MTTVTTETPQPTSPFRQRAKTATPLTQPWAGLDDPAARHERILKIREAINGGQYETDDRLERAADSLLDALEAG